MKIIVFLAFTFSPIVYSWNEEVEERMEVLEDRSLKMEETQYLDTQGGLNLEIVQDEFVASFDRKLFYQFKLD